MRRVLRGKGVEAGSALRGSSVHGGNLESIKIAASSPKADPLSYDGMCMFSRRKAGDCKNIQNIISLYKIPRRDSIGKARETKKVFAALCRGGQV